MVLTGYEVPGPPRWLCGWCLEPTNTLGAYAWSDRLVPLHLTCALQANIIRKRLEAGARPDQMPNTVARRRYVAMVRRQRKLQQARNRMQRGIPLLPRGRRLLAITVGDGS